jgi:hypothetical protein
MDVSGGILASLDAGHPCRHDEDPAFSFSVGERKIIIHFVVRTDFFVDSPICDRQTKTFAQAAKIFKHRSTEASLKINLGSLRLHH